MKFKQVQKSKIYLVLLLINTFSYITIYGQDCNGAAVATKESFLYGRFETVMQSAEGSGIVSSFFLYNIDTNCNWPEENNEIDVEMTGNNELIYFTTHHPGTEQPWHYGENFDLNFNPHESFHKYTIEWEPYIVRWFVDDELIYFQNDAATINLQYPMAILMNLWAADAESWVGEWDHSVLPQQSKYDYVKYSRYTPGEGNEGTDNNFTFEWEDHFSVLDTARWDISEFGEFGGNFCTFRQNNVQINNDTLLFIIDVPQVNTAFVPVTFSVNVAELDLSPTDIVYLNGSFNNWCGSCEPMIKSDNIWQVSLDLPPGKFEYLFTINGWQETGNAPLGSECDYNPCDEYANYGLLIPSGSSEINLETHCWGQCPDCLGSTSTANLLKENKRAIIKIYDALGREVEERPGQLLFYLYDDGTIEKKIIWFDN